MSFATPALATFRREGLQSCGDLPLPAIFVMEPAMPMTSAVTASWCPVALLQMLGATQQSGIAAGWATIEHAIYTLSACTVVVCAEGTVRPDRSTDRERLPGVCMAIQDDPVLSQVLRSRGVAVEALWFDTAEGDIFRWNAKGRRFDLLADDGLARFFADIHERAGSAPNATTLT